MSDVIDIDGHRIDAASQAMLLALQDGPATVSELREQSDLDEYSQVSYRLDKHLLPAGLVQDVDAVERTVELTGKGQHYVEREEMDARTLDEVREIAMDAQDETDDLAREIEAFEERIEERMENVAAQPELHDRLDQLEDYLYHDPQDEWIFDHNFNRLDDLHRSISQVEDRVDELEETVDGLKTSLDEVRDEFQSHSDEFQQRRERTNTTFSEFADRLSEIEEELERLDEETISNLEEEVEEMQEGRLSKLFGGTK